MFNNERCIKIRYVKSQKWRLEHAAFDYIIKYCSSRENLVLETFTISCVSSAITASIFASIHNGLYHFEINQLLCLVWAKISLVLQKKWKTICASCRICVEIKSLFYYSPESALIKTARSVEWLSIDFNEPLSFVMHDTYLLIVIDKDT